MIGGLAVWEWPGADPPILFVHATGFHGRVWDRVIQQFSGRRCIAPDLRGHGRSVRTEPPCHWSPFARDVVGITEALKLRGAVGVGHSMGGHLLVQAAAAHPEAFTELVLVDATIFPREFYGQRHFDAGFIRRRRNRWDSPEEMFARFRPRAPFASWDPQVLRDYCEFGLVPADGGYVLACPPEVEASIYEHCNEPEADIYRLFGRIEQPVTVMRAGILARTDKFDLAGSPSAPDLATKFPRAVDMELPGRNHYFPQETPELVADAISDRIARSAGFARP